MVITIVELFGMKVALELIPNIDKVTKDLKDNLKNIPFGLGKQIGKLAGGVQGGAFGADLGGKAVGIASSIGKMLGKLSIISGSMILIS